MKPISITPVIRQAIENIQSAVGLKGSISFIDLCKLHNPAHMPLANNLNKKSLFEPVSKQSILDHITTVNDQKKSTLLGKINCRFSLIRSQDKQLIREQVVEKYLNHKHGLHIDNFAHKNFLSKEEIRKVWGSVINQKDKSLIFNIGGIHREIKKTLNEIDKAHNMIASEISSNDKTALLESAIKVRVDHLRLTHFLNGTSFKDSDVQSVMLDLKETHPYLNESARSISDKIKNEMEKKYDFFHGNEGSRMVADKTNAVHKFLDKTLIKTVNGHVLQLVNSMTKSEFSEFQKKYNMTFSMNKNDKYLNVNGVDEPAHSLRFGKGGYGKVRLGKYLDENGAVGYIAIKKFVSNKDHKNAKTELAFKNMLNDNLPTDRICLPIDEAHVYVEKDGKIQAKSYVILPIAERGSGIKNMTSDEKIFHNQVYAYTAAVVQLHAHGISHHDIKPDNFLHFNDGVKITDFGFAHKGDKRNVTGTTHYNPPEAYTLSSTYHLSADKDNHRLKFDAFSLGMTLLHLKLNMPPIIKHADHLHINGKNVTLEFFKAPKGHISQNKNTSTSKNEMNFSEHMDAFSMNNFFENNPKAVDIKKVKQDECNQYSSFGLHDSESLKGETVDEVIAKLLHSDPEKRISATDALNLPFFKKFHAAAPEVVPPETDTRTDEQFSALMQGL